MSSTFCTSAGGKHIIDINVSFIFYLLDLWLCDGSLCFLFNKCYIKSLQFVLAVAKMSIRIIFAIQ